MIIVDGSHEEGGGSILRLSLALSVYTQKPFRMINIRKSRHKPGLNSQNLASVFLAQKICNAKVIDARRGSFEIEFYPREIVSKNIDLEIGSAGSIILALQSVFLPALLSGKKFNFTIKGGTDVAWSPGYDYFKEVFLPMFEDLGQFDCKLLRRGYYPKGGGIISLKIKGFDNILPKPFDIESLGRLIAIRGSSNASKDLEEINFADREADNVLTLLSEDVPIRIKRSYADADNTGSGLLVYGIFEQENNKLFRTGIYRVSPKIKGTVAEEVASEFKQLIHENVPVDEFLGDQLVPFLAIFKGKIKTTPLSKHASKHLLANIYVTKLFLEENIVVEEDGLIHLKS